MPQKNSINGKSVLVGISGGIDSSAALLFLKEQGFDVAGLFLKMNNIISDKNRKRTKEIAALLGIQLFEKNISKEFNRKITQYFIDDYKKNLTPNPCVVCNREIKFRFLLNEAQKRGYDFIATGHYAKIRKNKKGIFSLRKGKDKDKDQSYFLYQLEQDVLEKTIFPLGGSEKKQIKRRIKRSILKDINFEKESQDICFFNDKTNLKKFLLKNIKKTKKGNITNEKGEALGKHQGLELYTKGQRKGLRLSGGPYFVIGKDMEKGNLIVSKNKNHPNLLSKEIKIESVNWIAGEPLSTKAYSFKNRYRSNLAKGHFIKKGLNWTVVLNKKQWAVMPGQSLVAYDGQKVVGGGIIEVVSSE